MLPSASRIGKGADGQERSEGHLRIAKAGRISVVLSFNVSGFAFESLRLRRRGIRCLVRPRVPGAQREQWQTHDNA